MWFVFHELSSEEPVTKVELIQIISNPICFCNFIKLYFNSSSDVMKTSEVLNQQFKWENYNPINVNISLFET